MGLSLRLLCRSGVSLGHKFSSTGPSSDVGVSPTISHGPRQGSLPGLSLLLGLCLAGGGGRDGGRSSPGRPLQFVRGGSRPWGGVGYDDASTEIEAGTEGRTGCQGVEVRGDGRTLRLREQHRSWFTCRGRTREDPPDVSTDVVHTELRRLTRTRSTGGLEIQWDSHLTEPESSVAGGPRRGVLSQ